MKKPIAFRPTKIIQSYIDSELLKHPDKKKSQIIIELLENTLSYSGQEEPSSSSLPVKRGESIETYQQVRRHDHVLLPCPSSGKWVDRELDCEKCTLKNRCRILKFEHYFLEGVAMHTHS